MKKMKTTIAATVALAACASTQLFADVAKENTITLSLTGTRQVSVSTSPTVANAGTWAPGNNGDGPYYYKTGSFKVTEKDVIHYISFVLWGNANHYSSSAKLVLDQAELSGFFTATPDLGDSVADLQTGSATRPNGTFTSADTDASTTLANSFDSLGVVLDNGRHWDLNPDDSLPPVGHLQPWGQIWIKDTVNKEYDNVTYFFALSVQECYDCFYLNSYVTASTFKQSVGSQNGPPCCTTPKALIGNGKDSYYLTLSFDNTVNNPYLNPTTTGGLYIGNIVGDLHVVGVATTTIPGDGIDHDTIPYNSSISATVGKNEPYEARFTLNGVLTYTWTLKRFNSTDVSPDFVGTASYPANGYGFIGLYCSLFTGSAAFTEKLVNAATTVDALTGVAWASDWYGVGAEYVSDGAGGYAGTAYNNSIGDIYPTPINISTSLSYHENYDFLYPSDKGDFAPGAWPSPAYIPEP